MSTIHFIGGEKGGVGKSVVARLCGRSATFETAARLGAAVIELPDLHAPVMF